MVGGKTMNTTLNLNIWAISDILKIMENIVEIMTKIGNWLFMRILFLWKMKLHVKWVYEYQILSNPSKERQKMTENTTQNTPHRPNN